MPDQQHVMATHKATFDGQVVVFRAADKQALLVAPYLMGGLAFLGPLDAPLRDTHMYVPHVPRIDPTLALDGFLENLLCARRSRGVRGAPVHAREHEKSGEQDSRKRKSDSSHGHTGILTGDPRDTGVAEASDSGKAHRVP